ncbi:TetR/AcrR family transcriptional regulator [Spongiimicrobium sp. 3-5]|uniref:TetR/AcrR family transcriptional regulator n=1 Tax=Spongiimicrobium sp. 3-5 TaxID=3332596 RepID=UPI00398145F7
MKKLSVRERIIETASRLFYYEGYNQTGINQIIEEAGVAKSSMYQSFRSKEDIAVAYLQQRHFNWMGALSDFVSTRPSNKDKVLACFDFMAKWLKQDGYRGCGFQNIITDLPAEQGKIRDQTALHKNEVHKWIYSLLSEENYDDAAALAEEVMVLMEGAIILSQIQHNAWPIKAAQRACTKLLA